MQRPGRGGHVVLFVCAVVVSMTTAYFWLLSTGPYDSTRIGQGLGDWRPNGVMITMREARTGGLRDGDLVTAVDGRSLATWAGTLLATGAARPKWQAGQTVVYTVERAGELVNVHITLARYPLRVAWEAMGGWAGVLPILLFVTVPLVVFYKRPNEPAAQALLLLAIGASSGLYSIGVQVYDLVLGRLIGWYFGTVLIAYTLVFCGLLHFALVFPKPATRLAKQRWLIPLIYGLPFAAHGLLITIQWFILPNPLIWLGRIGLGVVVGELIYVPLTVAALVRGYRTARDPVSRRQVRWVVWGLLVSVGLWFAGDLLPRYFGLIPATGVVQAIIPVLLPLSVAAAILRYRLFDIDLLLNRTLVYAGLTAVVIGLYVLIVGAFSLLSQTSGNVLVALLVTGLVAVVFQPVRDRLQRGVNRLMYGQRDEPYAVLAQLGQRLEATLAVDAVLPAVVETVARALKLPYAAVVLGEGPQAKIAAEFGSPLSDVLRIPLVYRGENVGELVAAGRGSGEAFTAAERQLLINVARQAGAAAYAVRLAADLQRSRERLVTAREEERRRLRRDLHDGLGPQLASQTLTLAAASKLLRHDADRAEALLDDARAQNQTAIADIRRVVYDLRPPALDDLGLVAALQEEAARYQVGGLRVTVQAPTALPPLPAAVEVACYRIAHEALTNVVRHAEAQACLITLQVNGALCLEIRDDGRGLDPAARGGVGLTAMRERAAELGGTCDIVPGRTGGTVVSVRLQMPAGQGKDA